MRLLLYILLSVSCTQLLGANFKPDSAVVALMHKGVDKIEQKDYLLANSYFMQCLNSGTILPDDLAFHFGKSLYYTNYPLQSEQFLRKYLSLKDTTALFYRDAEAYLDSLHLKVKAKIAEKEAAKEKAKENLNAPCEGYEDVICPICDGAGVIKKNGKFGPIFKTCQYCDDHGLMSCDDYLKYREGTLYDEQ